jgi:hypothetical protein
MLSLYNLQPLFPRRGTFLGQPMIEKGLDSCLLAIIVIRVIRDEADKTT